MKHEIKYNYMRKNFSSINTTCYPRNHSELKLIRVIAFIFSVYAWNSIMADNANYIVCLQA